MDRAYWIGRMNAAMTMARGAATAEARLTHYELAGRYSIKAASSLPFLITHKGPATPGERAALHLPRPNWKPDAGSGENPRAPKSRRPRGNGDER
jgi:hypothetical protein